jgi:hypothetical protein
MWKECSTTIAVAGAAAAVAGKLTFEPALEGEFSDRRRIDR